MSSRCDEDWETTNTTLFDLDSFDFGLESIDACCRDADNDSVKDRALWQAASRAVAAEWQADEPLSGSDDDDDDDRAEQHGSHGVDPHDQHQHQVILNPNLVAEEGVLVAPQPDPHDIAPVAAALPGADAAAGTGGGLSTLADAAPAVVDKKAAGAPPSAPRDDIDVVSGRGGKSNHHPGTKRYRDQAVLIRPRYWAARNNIERNSIASELVAWVEVENEGRFWRFDQEARRWVLMTKEQIFKKVMQFLREGKPKV